MNLLRGVILLGCLLGILGMAILGGAEAPFPYEDDIGPTDERLASFYDSYVGQEIATSGIVTAADTHQVHIAPADTDLVVELQLDERGDLPLEDGHHIEFSGTIAADRTIVITPDDQVWIRAPWERHYMFAISFGGALLTALLIGNYWRYDLDDRVIELREPPLVPIFGA